MYHQKLEEAAKAHQTTLIKGWQKGYAVADLAELTNLSIPEVENIILQHKLVPLFSFVEIKKHIIS